MAGSIPDDIRSKILPDENLTVSRFLEMQIPLVLPTVNGKATDPEQYFSFNKPSVNDPVAATTIPCPPKHVVDMLRKSLTADVQSIHCIHTFNSQEKSFGTWIVQYWTELVVLRHARQRFSQALTVLERRRQAGKLNEEQHQLVNDAYEALSVLPWTGLVRGFGIQVDVHYLTSFVGAEWLSSEHINLLMELLRCELLAAGLASRLEVISETSAFREMLRMAYKNQNLYGQGKQNLRWLEKLGKNLGNGTCDKLAFMANINNNHWVAVVLDPEQRSIWHGDSFGAPMDTELQVMLKWWTYTHFSLSVTYQLQHSMTPTPAEFMRGMLLLHSY